MGRFGGTKKKSSGAPPQQVERGVGSSRAPISFVYSMKGPDGTTEPVRARVRPGELDAFLKYRFFFLRDAATGKRVQELSTFEELKDALETLESSGNSLWLEHPYDGLSERVNNIEKGVTNQANAFEMKSTRAIVKDSEFQAELKTSKLTPVNDGRSVKFCEVTKRGKLLELIAVDGLAMNRDDALLVVNEAKLSPSDKDIDDTEAKKWELENWLRSAAAQKTKFATQPAEVQGELFGEGEEGITWKIHLVLSGDNFAAEMEEECGAAEIFVVRSNGAGYGFSRPSSASSTSTEPAPDMPPSSPSASPSSAPLPLGRPESAV